MTALLKFESVTLQFGGLTALSNVSWEISQSGVHGIIGPNGAGKSTLFNLSTGIYRPTHGEISFDGISLRGKGTSEISRLGIARTFQNIRLLENLTVLDNLQVAAAVEREGTFWMSLFGSKKAQSQANVILERARGLLKVFGLSRLENAYPSFLPYGDQRKLEIARALMRKPKLLLLDEPAAGMNPAEKNELDQILKSIAKGSLTLLVIDHDMKFIMNLCEKITVLDQGSLCTEGSPAEIQEDPRVITLYLGKRKISQMKTL